MSSSNGQAGVEVPKGLKPYIFHGVQLDYSQGSEQAKGDCPFCGKEGKFYVNVDDGRIDCKVCGDNGNIPTFLRRLHGLGIEIGEVIDSLAIDRRFLTSDPLVKWGVTKSPLTDEWLVPGYNPDGKLNNLYRYQQLNVGEKFRLWPTTGINQALFGIPLWDSKKPEVYVCEGCWDGMALYEILSTTKHTSEGLVRTSSESSSIFAKANIIAVPGANVWIPSWSELLGGKTVYLMYDNDYPKINKATEKEIEPAGFSGIKRVVSFLLSAKKKPESISYIHWSKDTDDGYTKELPDGCDVRDFLTAGENGKPANHQLRIHNLARLLGRLRPIPDDWLTLRTRDTRVEVEDTYSIECNRWDVLINAYRKALKWNEGLDRALSVMLAVILSTETSGDQLWCKIVGPASSGKSTLCEALSTNKQYIVAKSTLRGFHSGYKADKEGKEDTSLVSTLNNKTLIIKDGDTLLQSPNLNQILSEARDIYDRVSRTSFRNGINRDYDGISMTWLLCGTESLRILDSSELGERFLDCVIVDKINEEDERDVARRVVYRAFRQLSIKSEKGNETKDGPDIVTAKKLTSGYINWLRIKSNEKLERVKESEAAAEKCIDLGTFVAYIRARPSAKQKEKVQREMSYRLVSQMARLAKCLAVVLNRKELDEEVIRRVRQVALDTARGRTFDICKHLYSVGVNGVEASSIIAHTGHDEEEEKKFITFLRKIGCIFCYTKKLGAGIKSRKLYRLSDKFRKLYGSVITDTNSTDS